MIPSSTVVFNFRHNLFRGPRWLSRYSDSLRAGRSGDRIPVGARFSVTVQTGPGAPPASFSMGTGSFPWVKRPTRGVDHPPPSSAEVEGRVELSLYSSSGPSWPVIGRTFTFTFNHNSCTSQSSSIPKRMTYINTRRSYRKS